MRKDRDDCFIASGITNAYPICFLYLKTKKRAVTIDNYLKKQNRKTATYNVFCDDKSGTMLTAKYKSYSYYASI